ncbi:hypothetical protein COL26_18980 [Bacillus thuringiensis]|uniref:Uncharacterized protein n=1 Tax=Bacillus thuringiensis TaxID=1428 RepID=A0ABD6RXI1_BACTU|nr:hypothetical protein [Bacillus thuringiensis]PER42126.1 hypothetical protein CN495_32840 [Bacillus thuringiensis]PEU85695.1 hypothetical protein CN411_19980 [Bacillus thuringiensis]PFI03148.1 hypothetical protein COI79_29690 [Bacillus thuringiensis]PFW37240.1 hypothetical protein COL26_18980 [Bacillus thuringiensis]
MNFEDLRNTVRQFINEEESSFSFTPDMFGFDISQGSFSELLDSKLIIQPMTITYTDSFIQIEGTSNINSINLGILFVFFIEDEIVKYHCILSLPDDWIHNKIPDLINLFKHFEDISGINYNLHHPGLLLSTGGPFLGKVDEIRGLPLNITGFTIFSEIEFSGGLLAPFIEFLEFPNILKLIIPTYALNTIDGLLIKAIYDMPKSKGAITLDTINFYFAQSRFELSCNLRISIGIDTLIFQTGVNFVDQGDLGFIFRLVGVQTNNKPLTEEWINPLGIPRITISNLAAGYTVVSEGFKLSLTGTIKSASEQNDEIILNIDGLELLNGTLPTAFIGSIHQSNGSEITMAKLIDSFISPVIAVDSNGIESTFYPLIDAIKVKDFKLYCVIGPEDFQSPEDPSIKFSPGIGMYVDGVFYSYNVKMKVSQNNLLDFLISGQMDILNFCDGMIVLTSASDGNKGPIFKFQPHAQGNPVFDLDIKVNIFDLSMTTVNAHLESNNVISLNLSHENIHANQNGIRSCNGQLINSNEFNAQFSMFFRFDIQLIKIKILNYDTCEINIYLAFALNASMNASLNECHITAKFDVDLLGISLPISISTQTVFKTVKDFEEAINNETIKAIQDHFNDTEIDDLLNWFDNNWLFFIDPLGTTLNKLGIPAPSAAKLINGLIKYKDNPKEILNILSQGGYSEADLKNITAFPLPGDWKPDFNFVPLDPGNIKPTTWPKL